MGKNDTLLIVLGVGIVGAIAAYSLAKPLKDTAGAVGDLAKDTRDFGNESLDQLSQIDQSIANSISGSIDKTAELTGIFVDEVADTTGDIWGAVEDTTKGIFDYLTDKIKNLPTLSIMPVKEIPLNDVAQGYLDNRSGGSGGSLIVSPTATPQIKGYKTFRGYNYLNKNPLTQEKELYTSYEDAGMQLFADYDTAYNAIANAYGGKLEAYKVEAVYY